MTPPLLSDVHAAFHAQAEFGALTCAVVVDRRDRFLTLHQIYGLHLAPLDQVGDLARFQYHRSVAGLKQQLEQEWISELDAVRALERPPEDVREAQLDIAVVDRLPQAYRWVAREADWPSLIEFLAGEGGPGGGFDDLVALCQVGLDGDARLELARDYSDEMSNACLEAEHTVLYEDLVAVSAMPRIPRDQVPVSALERSALYGMLGTNRWLQPKCRGDLGMTVLQAGPRCRMAVQGFERFGPPEWMFPFYAEHAEVDLGHGADWVTNAVVPVVEKNPAWGCRIVRGAAWRATTNLRFFAEVLVGLHRNASLTAA